MKKLFKRDGNVYEPMHSLLTGDFDHKLSEADVKELETKYSELAVQEGELSEELNILTEKYDGELKILKDKHTTVGDQLESLGDIFPLEVEEDSLSEDEADDEEDGESSAAPSY